VFSWIITAQQHRFRVAKLSVPDARTITLQPFEKNTPSKKQSWWLTLVLINEQR
jgi:hypothetical protein